MRTHGRKCMAVMSVVLSLVLGCFSYGGSAVATEKAVESGDGNGNAAETIGEPVTAEAPVEEPVTSAPQPETPAPVTEASQPQTAAPATAAPATEKQAATEAVKAEKTESGKKSSGSKDGKKEKKTTEQKGKSSEQAATEAVTQATTEMPLQIEYYTPTIDVQQAVNDAEIAATKRQEAQRILDKLETAKQSVVSYITQLDESLNEMEGTIRELEKNQVILKQTMEETQEQFVEAKKAQLEQYEAMKLRIQMVYESGRMGYMDVLLTADTMSDMLNRPEYVNQVSFYDYNLLRQLKEAKEQVANLREKMDRDLVRNETYQAELKGQKEAVELLLVEKQKQMEQYAESIRNQKEEIQRYTRAEQEADALIASAEVTASRSINSTYTGGIFVWPVPGYTKISSYFGGREAPIAGASTFHKGIDIGCDYGSTVVAAAAGTVIVATYNYAAGNYICIDHGGGVVTVYMHNSSMLVAVGDTVQAGQQIALAGSTGVSTGPHCHFGVRLDGEYVDPLPYLQ